MKIKVGVHEIRYMNCETKVTGPLFCDSTVQITLFPLTKLEKNFKMRPLEEREGKSPGSQMKEEQNGNWVLGNALSRTMDSRKSKRGAGLPKEKSITQAVSMSKGIRKGTPNFKKGRRDLPAWSWGKGEKLPEGNGSNLECGSPKRIQSLWLLDPCLLRATRKKEALLFAPHT